MKVLWMIESSTDGLRELQPWVLDGTGSSLYEKTWVFQRLFLCPKRLAMASESAANSYCT